MKLRSQMLIAGALTLAIPVIGWQSVKQLDASLQQTRIDQQTLKVANARVALAEADELQTVLNLTAVDTVKFNFHAENAEPPIFLDGYADDWTQLRASPYVFADHEASLSVRIARRGGRLYLFLKVNDADVVLHKPPALKIDFAEGEKPDNEKLLVNGDAIELLVSTPEGQTTHALLRAIAPGSIDGLVASHVELENSRANGRRRNAVPGRSLPGYRGYWVARSDGFQIEVELPLPPLGSSFDIVFVDVDEHNGPRRDSAGSMSAELMRQIHRLQDSSPNAEANLHYTADSAVAKLEPWVTPGVRARVFNRHGLLVADLNHLYDKSPMQQQLDPAKGSFFNAVLFRLFAYFVSGDSELDGQAINLEDDLHLTKENLRRISPDAEPTTRYVTTERDRVLGTLVEIGGENPNGYLLFESNEELAASYASSRLARLFSLLTLVSILAGGVLFLFATMLSLRIRKLSKQASLAVADDGRVRGLPDSSARDEIGDLSRNLSALLNRSANYTQYLEALSGRLSHELRTPLSVVKTSIENMDRERMDEDTRKLIDRASGGADQLGSIIRALVESTRLEQTVQNTQMSKVDLPAWMQGSLARYSQVYPHIQFSLSGKISDITQDTAPLPRCTSVASPELLQQAFDKLVDNAVEFSEDGKIQLVLSPGTDSHGKRDISRILLAVVNNGPAIPAEMSSKLFDPMFSSRNQRDERLHLGLGLYIVKMIAEAHGGRPFSKNLASSVAFGFSVTI